MTFFRLHHLPFPSTFSPPIFFSAHIALLLHSDWRRFALKGHKGFKITDQIIQRGITADELRKHLKHIDGAWYHERVNTDGSVRLVPAPGAPLPPTCTDPTALTTPSVTDTNVNTMPTNDTPMLIPHSKKISNSDYACLIVPPPISSNTLPAQATVTDVDMTDPAPTPPSTASPSTSTISLAPRAQMASFVEDVFTSFNSTVKSLTEELNNLRDEVRVLREDNISYRSARGRSSASHSYQSYQAYPSHVPSSADSHQQSHRPYYPYHHAHPTTTTTYGPNGIPVDANESISTAQPRAPPRQFYTYPPPAPPADYVPANQYPESPPPSAHAPTHLSTSGTSTHLHTNNSHTPHHNTYIDVDTDTEMSDTPHSRPHSTNPTNPTKSTNPTNPTSNSECSMPAFSPYTHQPIPFAGGGRGLGEAMAMDDVDGMGGILAGPVKSQRKRFTRG